MLSIFTKCMSYLYVILKENMCLWDRTYFKMNSLKRLNVSKTGFNCHLKVKLFLNYKTRVTLNGRII